MKKYIKEKLEANKNNDYKSVQQKLKEQKKLSHLLEYLNKKFDKRKFREELTIPPGLPLEVLTQLENEKFMKKEVEKCKEIKKRTVIPKTRSIVIAGAERIDHTNDIYVDLLDSEKGIFRVYAPHHFKVTAVYPDGKRKEFSTAKSLETKVKIEKPRIRLVRYDEENETGETSESDERA